MATTTAIPGRGTRPGAAEIRAALLGRGHHALSVLQQAYRLTPEHSDEIDIFRSGSEYWVAARFGDETVVWACHDRFAAEDQYDQVIDGDRGWRQVAASAA